MSALILASTQLVVALSYGVLAALCAALFVVVTRFLRPTGDGRTRNRAIGRFLQAAAPIMCVLIVLLGFLDLRSSGRGPLPGILADALQSLSVGLAVSLMFAIVHFARRISTREAAEALRDDPRPPLVYLRSFSGEKRDRFVGKQSLSLTFASSNEEVFAPVLKRLGPFVALGDPRDKLATPGADRMYLDDDSDWRREIMELIERSALVLIRADISPNTLWEITNTVALKSPSQVVLFVPYAIDDERRDEKFREFRDKTGALFPGALPESIGDTLFIGFDGNWGPILVGPRSTDAAALPDAKLRQAFSELAPLFWAEHDDGTFHMVAALVILMLVIGAMNKC